MTQATIPNVELGAELGRGAHSVVLRGSRDGRSYAVKLPLEVGTSAEREVAYRRFLREAAALARVHHSSLPAVMEVGRAGGVPYLIMELASGETLADRLDRGAMTEGGGRAPRACSSPVRSKRFMRRGSCIATSSRGTSCSTRHE